MAGFYLNFNYRYFSYMQHKNKNSCFRKTFVTQFINYFPGISAWKREVDKTEAATGCVLQENVFLEIWQDSQENTCVRVSF